MVRCRRNSKLKMTNTLLRFAIIIALNQQSRIIASPVGRLTMEKLLTPIHYMGNRLNNRIEENYYESKQPSEKCCVEFEPKDKGLKANTRGKGNVNMHWKRTVKLILHQ